MMPTHISHSHTLRTLAAPLAVVIGVLFLSVAWIGHWVMEGFWPGPFRLWVGSGIGLAGIVWGGSSVRRFVLIDGGRLTLTLRESLVMVAALVAGATVLVLFYNW